MPPVLMPNIKSRLLCDGLTESVVPGHTRTSPPRGKCKMVVSDPAVMDDPDPSRPASMTAEPVSLVTGITSASLVSAKPAATGGSDDADFLPAFTSPGGRSLTIKRFPAPSHECP